MDDGTLSHYDLAWLAHDNEGRVAVFTTGGPGPIPASALASLDTAESAVRSLSESCDSELLDPSAIAFLAFAKRGFFAYDWTDVHRTQAASIDAYELVARPSRPAQLQDLPLPVRSIAMSTNVRSVTFGVFRVPRGAIA